MIRDGKIVGTYDPKQLSNEELIFHMTGRKVEGKKAIQKCKYTKLTEEGRERALEIVASTYNTALEKARASND